MIDGFALKKKLIFFFFSFFSSDGVWDPEKWHASLYPSECDLTGEAYKRDYAEDRPPLKRRIAGKFMYYF